MLDKNLEIGKAFRHKITINPSMNNGYILEIGCGVFVFTTVEKLLEALRIYFRDPDAMEREYNLKLINTGAVIHCSGPEEAERLAGSHFRPGKVFRNIPEQDDNHYVTQGETVGPPTRRNPLE